jgi:hypothetical protein
MERSLRMTGFIPLSTIDIGTEMLFIPMNQEQESKDEFLARFNQTTGYTSFVAESKPLYDIFNERTMEPYFTVQFITIKQKRCGFSSLIKDTMVKKDSFFVNVDQLSPIQESSIRKAERHNISIPVSIFTLGNNDQPNDLILSAMTFDVSTGGLCILTTSKINLEKNCFTILELNFSKNLTFRFKAELIRIMPCTKTSQYKFEYGFIFNEIEDSSDEKSRLISAILDHKLSSFR